MMTLMRRDVLRGTMGVGLLSVGIPGRAAAPRPLAIQSADPGTDQALFWALADGPGRMVVEVHEPGRPWPRRLTGPVVDETTDYAATMLLKGFKPGAALDYRIYFENAAGQPGDALQGRLRLAPDKLQTVRFLWSGDLCGQGWGIDVDRGGYAVFSMMRDLDPDFLVFCGDHIYADNPLQPEVVLEDGQVWRNVVTAAKSKVAETLHEFRGNYRYNLLDPSLRAFAAHVPQIHQWDDHEVLNNWYPQEILDDPRYREQRVAVLAQRARQAFLEHCPLQGRKPGRIERHLPHGPLLDVFVLDMRTDRGPNTTNLEPAGAPFLGREQLDWLKMALVQSTGLWKVIAADMPLGLVVPDGAAQEGLANADDGPPAGREVELMELLSWIKAHDLHNVVWLTTDVHYTAAHRYEPARAAFKDFLPFWEFVSGPLHAGTFGPSLLDGTFGPQVVFQEAPSPGMANLPPNMGLQYVGEVVIDGGTGRLTVNLRNAAGLVLFSEVIQPVR